MLKHETCSTKPKPAARGRVWLTLTYWTLTNPIRVCAKWHNTRESARMLLIINLSCMQIQKWSAWLSSVCSCASNPEQNPRQNPRRLSPTQCHQSLQSLTLKGHVSQKKQTAEPWLFLPCQIKNCCIAQNIPLPFQAPNELLQDNREVIFLPNINPLSSWSLLFQIWCPLCHRLLFKIIIIILMDLLNSPIRKPSFRMNFDSEKARHILHTVGEVLQG